MEQKLPKRDYLFLLKMGSIWIVNRDDFIGVYSKAI